MTRTLLNQARRAARARTEPPDLYTAGLALLIVLGFPVQVLIGVAVRTDGGRGAGVAPASFVLAAAVIVMVVALAAGMAVGPVRMSRAEYTLVLSAPLDRRSELRRRWLVGLVVAAGLGAVLGPSAAILAGGGWRAVGGSAVWGAALGVATLNGSVAVQGAPAGVRRHARWAASGLAAGALLTMALTTSTTAVQLPGTAGWVGGAVGLVAVAGAATAAAWAAIAGLDRVALTAGNALATATSAAVIFLDPALLGGVLAQRRLAGAPVSRSRSLPRGRSRAVLTADLVRAQRNRRAQVVFLGCVLVPYAAAAVAPRAWVPVTALLAGAAAVSPFADGLRQISSSPVLRRMLGGRDWTVRSLHVIVPLGLAVLFAGAAAPAAPEHLFAALVLTPVGIMVNLVLRASAKPAEFRPAVADLGLGPIPVDLIWFLVRSLGPFAFTAYVQLNL